MDKKPTPKVVKRTRKDGTPVTTEYHVYQDGFIKDGLDGTHVSIPEPEAIDESVVKVLLNKIKPSQRDLDRLKRHFTKAKPRKLREPREVKTFPQFLINLKGREEEFADRLRTEFSTERGIRIRHMLEALKKLTLIAFVNSDQAPLYSGIKDYFNRDIGRKTGVFDMRDDVISKHYKKDIEAAVTRIQSILKDFTPAP